MKDAADYLTYIKALMVVNPQVLRWTVVREEVQGDMGMLRYRLTLSGSGPLEIFERFQVVEGRVQVAKYSFHWQDAAGQLLKRWDNAAHHREISTHPHHVHDPTSCFFMVLGGKSYRFPIADHVISIGYVSNCWV